MEQENVAYWVNGAHGEWGTVDAATAAKLEKRQGFRRTSNRDGLQGWVESFVAAMRKDGTILLVESQEEFRYLYRCFETLSMPLSYCPLAPRSKKGNGVPASATPSQMAA